MVNTYQRQPDSHAQLQPGSAPWLPGKETKWNHQFWGRWLRWPQLFKKMDDEQWWTQIWPISHHEIRSCTPCRGPPRWAPGGLCSNQFSVTLSPPTSMEPLDPGIKSYMFHTTETVVYAGATICTWCPLYVACCIRYTQLHFCLHVQLYIYIPTHTQMSTYYEISGCACCTPFKSRNK